MKIFYLLILISISFQIFSQTFINGFEIEMEVKKSTKIIDPSSDQIIGIYKFGDSEGESELFINKIDDSYIIQIKYGTFVTNTENQIDKFAYRYYTIQNIVLKDGVLKGNNFEANFYNVETHKNMFGLHVLETDFELINKNEFGKKIGKGNDFYEGDFTIASKKFLSDDFLNSQSLRNLKLMRNEIYARYGYDFKSGGEMEKYFEKKSWYAPNSNFNEALLTVVEKKNVEKIIQFEKTKK